MYHIDASPRSVHIVYAFAEMQYGKLRLLYVGRTTDKIQARYPNPSERVPAKRLGANRLLIYEAGRDIADAERRLIATYNPPLNTHYRTV